MFPALRMLFVFVLLGVPAAVVGIPWSALRGNFDAMYQWGMVIMRLGVGAAGIRVRRVGLENVPAGRACIFVSNHVSNLDPPVLLPSIPGKASVFLKKSLMKIPLLGKAMEMGRFIPVSRGHSREEAQKSVEYAAGVLRDGLHIMMFPEGTRSPDGKLQVFKKGAFYLAAEAGAPMVPVVIQGTRELMPKGTLLIRPAKPREVVVEFLPPIWPKMYGSREELMAAVRTEIESALERGRPA